MEGGVPHLLAAAVRPARTRLTSTNIPSTRKENHPGTVGAGAHPGTPGSTSCRYLDSKQTPRLKPGIGTISNHTWRTLND
jgi:hypothetical protein